MDGGLAGLALAIGVMWDAVSDPLMGIFADRVKTRWGNRRPYLVLGPIVIAASVWALFLPARTEASAVSFWYLLIVYCALNTGLTIIGIPYAALGGEGATSPAAVGKNYAWRFILGNLGAVMAVLIPSLMVSWHVSPRGVAFSLAIFVFVAAILLVRILPANSQPKFAEILSKPPKGFLNRHFVWLLLAYFIGMMGIGISTALSLYFYGPYLRLTDSESKLAMACFLVSSCFAAPLWVKLSDRWGRGATLRMGLSLFAGGVALIYPLLPHGKVEYALAANLVLGGLMAVCGLLEAYVTEVAKVDGSGLATCFGVWKFSGKASRALSIAVTGQFVAWISSSPGQLDPTRMHYVAWAFGPVVGLFLLSSVVSLHQIDRVSAVPVELLA